MDHNLNELVSRLTGAQPDNLVSVVVYGSAVTSSGNAKKSDYQTLIITRRLTSEDLRRIRPVAQWWRGQGYALPVFFTEAEFQDSLDVFPIEFRHMKRSYRVLHGQDLLASCEVSKANLRLETEYELRGKLLRLRSLSMPAGESAEELTKLMAESVVSFVRFMRPILELLGEEPPLGRAATATEVGQRLNVDTAPIVRVLRLREESKSLMEAEAQDLFASYLNCLTEVIAAVDKL
ncbi:MAG: hypothetical protein M3X11_07030 [Acidobacteriota bacterium]|nr:hypothetical protein [Acidobacteriota bacterium]